MKKYNITQRVFMSLLIVVLTIVSFNAFSHFGSRGPFGGSVSCALVKDTMVYIGTTNGGVFFNTRQSLIGWRARPVGLKSGKITALAHSGEELYAATADSGVYKFTGAVGSDLHWVKINNGLTNLNITSLVSLDANTLFAGTAGGGVFKTTDKGASWVAVNNADLHHFDIFAIANASGRIIHASEGLWASDDEGASWFDFNDLNTEHIETYAISHNTTTDELLILNDNGLFITTTASSNTTPVYTAVQTGLPSGIVIRSISNNGTNWYLATDDGVYTSPTGTISWVSINTGLSTEALNVNAVVPYQTRLVMGTNSEGIFKSPASSVSWTANNANFNNLITYSLTTGGENLIVAATEKGVFVSKDLAATYQRANNGLLDSLNVNDLVFVDTRLFAATKNQGIFMSVDSGAYWTSFNAGLVESNIEKVLAVGSSLYAFGASGNVYRSGGFGWSSIQAGLPSGVKPTSLIVFNTTLLLGTLGDGVFTRPESSGSWTASNNGLANLDVTSLTASGSKLYAGTDGSGIFSSDFAAINWSSVTLTSISHTPLIGLDDTKIQAMAYYEGYVYASYKGGVVATSDNGATWIPAGNQFNLPSYTDVRKISFVTTRVFVSTENNSLYSNSLSELPTVTSIKELNTTSNVSKIQIIPNPNNGNFVVGLGDLTGTVLETIVYDAIGNVLNRYGKEHTEISEAYPAGLYYVQVKTSNGEYTKKMIVE